MPLTLKLFASIATSQGSASPESSRAHVIAWAHGELVLAVAVAAPPGARLDVDVADPMVTTSPHGAHVPSFRLKVHRCRRQEDGSFLLAGRPLDLRRETREALDLLAEPGRV